MDDYKMTHPKLVTLPLFQSPLPLPLLPLTLGTRHDTAPHTYYTLLLLPPSSPPSHPHLPYPLSPLTVFHSQVSHLLLLLPSRPEMPPTTTISQHLHLVSHSLDPLSSLQSLTSSRFSAPSPFSPLSRPSSQSSNGRPSACYFLLPVFLSKITQS